MPYTNIPFNQEIANILTFPNPFEPEEEFRGYLLEKGKMIVPRHTPTLTKEKLKLVSHPISIKVSSTFSLLDYQVDPTTEITQYLTGDSGECLLTAKTGSGKSYSLGYVIQEVGQRTLILAHLSMLTEQMFQELSNNLDGDVRLIDSTNTELGDVNICTFQFLNSNPDMVELLAKNIGFVVVDECENLLSETRLSIYLKLQPKYQLLMSATPSRELTGRTPMIGYLVGNNRVVMEPIGQVEPKHVMLDYRDLQFYSPQSKMLYKGALTRFMMSSRIPSDVVLLCQDLLKFYGCIWIIIDSLKFQDYIQELLLEVEIPSEIIRGNTSKKERKRILEAVADKSCRVFIGSAPMSAGISIPEIGFAFRLMPHSSSKELLTQQEGRLKRPAEFKQTQAVLWFDLAIEGSLAYGGKQRFKCYKEVGRLTFGTVEKIRKNLKELLNV